MKREPIYVALFNLLQTVDGVKTFSRRLKMWDKVDPEDQPAIFLTQKKEMHQRLQNMPAKVTLQCEVYLYVNTGNDIDDIVPASEINPLMDAVGAALAPDASGRQTLGGLVYNCWIDGEVETDEGVLGPQAVAIIPLTILVNH